MSAPVLSAAPGLRSGERVRAALATAGAAVLGAAPHVLHHAGPLAGAALLAGAGGQLIFGALGFVLALPLLRRLRRRTGSWTAPGGVLVLMAIGFSLSSFVIGPAFSSGRDNSQPREPAPSPSVGPSEHTSHHQQ